MSKPKARNSDDPATGELIARVQAGDIEFYEEVVRRYQTSVLQVVSGMLYDRNNTEELAQQVFVNAYLHLDSFDVARDFGPWIRTIARNAVREHLRTTSRYTRRLEAYATILEVQLAGNDRAAAREERLREQLAHCLGKLSERSAALVQMRYQKRQSFADMARGLGTSAGALRNQLSRTRAKLRACIEKAGGAE
ncbi:MAG: sigma-70 family RNA polymerase sigma factor [Victivallales bacterium]|jgi:RNA polymerase sigma-70 factor, ECF subfamily|nr:sigma-70 family RNA polymerase sigma factor [Victivallales bacterium]MBT7298591.1 sigma-70 family RNA polymerase sigma factor [Victivallales bacterium]